MDRNEVLQAIARVRRAMPRNADVMLVCDAAEKNVDATPPNHVDATLTTAECPVCVARRKTKAASQKKWRKNFGVAIDKRRAAIAKRKAERQDFRG